MVLSEFAKKHPELRAKLTNPFVKNVNPDVLTWISFVVAIIAGYLFSSDWLFLGGIFVLVSAYLDILDGDIARKFKKQSKFGDFLDHTIDRLSDLAILVGIGFSSFVSLELALVTYIIILLVSYMGTQAQALTKERLYDGLLGRADRMALLFLAGFFSPLYQQLVYYTIILILALSAITFVQRFVATWALLKMK